MCALAVRKGGNRATQIGPTSGWAAYHYTHLHAAENGINDLGIFRPTSEPKIAVDKQFRCLRAIGGCRARYFPTTELN
jgi:hypothetical protein